MLPWEIEKAASIGKQLTVCQTRRNMEITHWRNQTESVIELIKTGFEFVGDGANLARTTNPVVALVSTVGVALFDFAGAWLKTM